MIAPGDIIQLMHPRGKWHVCCLPEQGIIETPEGGVPAEEILGTDYGGYVYTNRGKCYRVARAGVADIVKGVQRRTQIIYPKDIGFILMKLQVFPGARVIDAGAGSGSLTSAFAWFVGDRGSVYAYEYREEFCDLCQRNLQNFGLAERVEIRQQDIGEGFDREEVDALFVDVPKPWDYLHVLTETLKPGGTAGFLLPTVNQVSSLLEAIDNTAFVMPEVAEMFLRRYKVNPERLRPEDTMIGHTGFLVFCRFHPTLELET